MNLMDCEAINYSPHVPMMFVFLDRLGFIVCAHHSVCYHRVVC